MATNRILCIAKAVKQLTYDETSEVARDIVSMVQGRLQDDIPFDPEDRENWMEFLQSWATGVVEDAKE